MLRRFTGGAAPTPLDADALPPDTLPLDLDAADDQGEVDDDLDGGNVEAEAPEPSPTPGE